MWSYNFLLVVWSMFTFLCVVSQSDDDSTLCPNYCYCVLALNKKIVYCASANLTAIPDSLNPSIRSLDLSFNKIPVLPANAFLQVGLVKLEIIDLQFNDIKELDKDAFKDLQSLVELNLSGNKIHTIHPDTFMELVRLRFLRMSFNPIKALRNELFRNLTFLQEIDFSFCNMSSIELKTFDQLPNLQTLKLNGNHLTHIQLSSVESLSNLKSLDLRFNPWNCDCHLRDFRDWTISRGLFTRPPTCAEPSNLRCASWDSIDPEKFACKSKILYPPPGTIIKANGENVTLSCKVYGYPLPSVRWEYKSLVIDDNSTIPRYEVKSSNPNGRKYELWSNLTIANIRSEDKGEYICTINSFEGKEDRPVNLDI